MSIKCAPYCSRDNTGLVKKSQGYCLILKSGKRKWEFDGLYVGKYHPEV